MTTLEYQDRWSYDNGPQKPTESPKSSTDVIFAQNILKHTNWQIELLEVVDILVQYT